MWDDRISDRNREANFDIKQKPVFISVRNRSKAEAETQTVEVRKATRLP